MNPADFFRKTFQKHHGSQSEGGFTWDATSLSQRIKGTGSFFGRYMWLWPIVATTVLGVAGLMVHRAIESTMKESLKSELETLLQVETAMLKTWLVSQESNAESMANNINVRSMVLQILGEPPIVGTTATPLDLKDVSEFHSHFSDLLAPSLRAQNYNGYALIDRDGEVLMASEEDLVGRKRVPAFGGFMNQVIEGDSTVSLPFPSVAVLPDGPNDSKTGVPTMFVAAPVRDNNFQVVAVLAMRINPEKEFTRILQLGRIGQSGETYAFDKSGLMISNSRFDDDLILIGLISDSHDSRSLLQVAVRDPQGDMTAGYNPTVRRSKQPLTRMAASATKGINGVDVDGYNDYRGVPVVGAWAWLPKYGFGVATEEDVSEAYHSLIILKRVFWALLLLLLAASIAIFIFTLLLARLERKAREAAIKAKKLGQYQLQQKLGEGAMGVVYRGQHAMLRRPTAIKLINSSRVSERAIDGFEREVQITSQLTHPNTIAIYDFGRTPEGVFYYAMEYLDGIDLQQLVKDYGRLEPERVIFIIRQVCDSLSEAHMYGLVHRDVKPANIMLNRRGGMADVVKVLDFGLVHDSEESVNGSGFAGTPLYMSPEAIQTPRAIDYSSDIYSLGAVAYFLATGKPLFKEKSSREVCKKQISEFPPMPSELVETFPEDLESVIMSCLAKNRFDRPQTAREVARLLEDCEAAGKWNATKAENWWARHERKTKGLASIAPMGPGIPKIEQAGPDTWISPIGSSRSSSKKRMLDTARDSNTHNSDPSTNLDSPEDQ